MMGRIVRQTGLSLVELLIALGLGAFMLVGIISLVASVSSTRNQLAKNSEQIENGRYALQLFAEDAALAGFLGKYHPGVGVATYTLPSPCLDSTDVSKLGFKHHSTNPELPSAVEGFAAGSDLPGCIDSSNVTANSEVLVVRRVETTERAVASVPVGNTTPYLQISACASDAASFVFGTDPATFVLREKDCATVATVWPYSTRAYFISPCDDCTAPSDGVPTLKMREYAGGAVITQSLVNGVEDIHYEYGLDLDGDGGPDCYEPDPTLGAAPASCTTAGWSATPSENWANVVAIEVNILVRGVETTLSETTTKTYDIGRANRVGPFNDYYRRRVYSTVLTLPNVAGARE